MIPSEAKQTAASTSGTLSIGGVHYESLAEYRRAAFRAALVAHGFDHIGAELKVIGVNIASGLFIESMKEELDRARAKFPDAKHSLAALMEEVGELAKAILDESWARVRAEAIQVAVMACRVAVEGDRSFNEWREAKDALRAFDPGI